MGPAGEKLRILVVATRDVASEVRQLLVEAGFAEPTLGDGGDDTYAAYEDMGPHIVLLGAHLERGDARSLAAAMKGGEHGHFVRVILLGEADGPIRSALDATDFEVDRFLGSPLASKALSFAVHSCGAQALKAQASGAPVPTVDARPPPPPPASMPASNPFSTARATAPDETTEQLPRREPTLIVSGGGSGQPELGRPLVYSSNTSPKVIEAAIEAAIDEVENDEVGGDGGDDRAEGDRAEGDRAEGDRAEGDRAEGDRAEARASAASAAENGATQQDATVGPAPDDDDDDGGAMTNPRIGFAPTELSLAQRGGQGAGRHHSQFIDEAMEAAIAEFVSDAISSVRVGLDDAGRPKRASDAAPVAEAEPPAARDRSDGVPQAGPADETRKRELPIGGVVGVREPTLILSPQAAKAAEARAARVAEVGAGVFAITEQSTDVPAEKADKSDRWRADAASVGDDVARDAGLVLGRGATASDDDDELLDELDKLDGIDDELDDLHDDLHAEPHGDRNDDDLHDDDLTTRRADRDDVTTLERSDNASPKPVNGPSSGAVARELRRKMSAMAERLFPGQVPTSDAAEAFSLPHDANTEIDFSALESGQTGVLGRLPYRGIGRVETFADTNPLIEKVETDATRTTQSSYEGQLGLEGGDIAMLLARTHLANFSGTVVLTRGDARKTIHFDAGRPVFASSNLPRDRMGDLLYREGKITRAQHDQCNDLLEGSGRRMGELLVEMGFLKPRELLPAVRRHIEDIFYSVFSWDEGGYRVLEREASSEKIRLSRHPAALVVEGVRRKYGLERVHARLGSEDAVLARSDEKSLDSIIELADLDAREQAVLAAFDGVRGLGAISLELGIDRQTVAQLGFSLVALGAAEVVYQSADEEGATDSGRAGALVGETDIAIDRQRVLAKLALVEDADYFMLLGVRRDASRFEIQRAYEAARRDYASDAFPEPVRDELADEIATINALIDEAYQILGDDGMRRSYLEHLG